MDPVLFSVGRRVIYSYSVILGLSLIGALLWLAWQDQRQRDGRLDAALWSLLAAVVGARVAYVLANWTYFAESPGRIFALTQGGLSFHGGLLTGMVALVIVAFSRKSKPAPWTQELAFVAGALVGPLAVAVTGGWAACLFGGCAYGRAIPPPQRFYTIDWPDLYGVHAFRLPSQLLGLLLAVGLLLGYWHVVRRNSDPAPYAAWYLAAYGVGDFLLAFTRADLQFDWGPLLATQWVDLLIVLAGVALGYVSRSTYRARASLGGHYVG